MLQDYGFYDESKVFSKPSNPRRGLVWSPVSWKYNTVSRLKKSLYCPANVVFPKEIIIPSSKLPINGFGKDEIRKLVEMSLNHSPWDEYPDFFQEVIL